MKKLKLFQVDDTLDSYTYPLVKILVSLALIVFLTNRNSFFRIEKGFWNYIVTGISFCIACASLLCMRLAGAELILVHDNRSKAKSVSAKEREGSRKYSVDAILSLVSRNDSMEIQILSEGKRVEIGSSSECEAYDSKPYDKRYYIEKREFESLDAFRNAVLPYSDKGQITILSIDGISSKKYHRDSL